MNDSRTKCPKVKGSALLPTTLLALFYLGPIANENYKRITGINRGYEYIPVSQLGNADYANLHFDELIQSGITGYGTDVDAAAAGLSALASQEAEWGFKQEDLLQGQQQQPVVCRSKRVLQWTLAHIDGASL